MAEQESYRNRFREARHAFDQLDVEDKAVFLVEATLSTVARGIEEVGRVLADELDTLFQQRPTAEPSSEEATSDDEAHEPSPDPEAHASEVPEEERADSMEQEEASAKHDEDEEPTID